MSVSIVQVVAADKNNVIGDGNKLLWRISDDLKHFKSVTLGKPVVMGRKTFQSIGMVLPGRDNIIISRDPDFRADGTYLTRTIGDALALGTTLAEFGGQTELCVIGGAEIFEQTFAHTSRVYFTHVDAALKGDAHYLHADFGDWRATKLGRAEKSNKNQYDCEFLRYDRQS